MTYYAKVIAGGKIVIPAEIRRELGIADGDSLVVERDDAGSLVIKTYAQIVREVQDEFRRLRGPDLETTSVVDELLADRRLDAAREAEATERAMSARQ